MRKQGIIKGNYWLGFILVFILLLILDGTGTLRPLESGFVAVTQEVWRVVRYPFDRVVDWGRVIGEISKLRKDNRELGEENERLAAANATLLEQIGEMNADTAQIQFQQESGLDSVKAAIVNRLPQQGKQIYMLNKGEADGIVIGQPVVSASGAAVGIISRILDHTAYLTTLADPDMRISAKVQPSGVFGIVEGEHSTGLKMAEIDKQAAISKGDLVVTAGTDGKFPKGLLVGKIETVTQKESDLFQSANLEVATVYSRLEYVYVLKYSVQ